MESALYTFQHKIEVSFCFSGYGEYGLATVFNGLPDLGEIVPDCIRQGLYAKNELFEYGNAVFQWPQK